MNTWTRKEFLKSSVVAGTAALLPRNLTAAVALAGVTLISSVTAASFRVTLQESVFELQLSSRHR
jgi:hypothetical protein